MHVLFFNKFWYSGLESIHACFSHVLHMKVIDLMDFCPVLLYYGGGYTVPSNLHTDG